MSTTKERSWRGCFTFLLILTVESSRQRSDGHTGHRVACAQLRVMPVLFLWHHFKPCFDERIRFFDQQHFNFSHICKHLNEQVRALINQLLDQFESKENKFSVILKKQEAGNYLKREVCEDIFFFQISCLKSIQESDLNLLSQWTKCNNLWKNR